MAGAKRRRPTGLGGSVNPVARPVADPGLEAALRALEET